MDNNSLSEQLDKVLASLTHEEKIQKAVRHFFDSYYLRTSRNDIDGTNKWFLLRIW
jgi:hypothetical protein